MSDLQPISLARVEPLTSQNYQVWALKVGAILRSRKLFNLIIEQSEPPIVSAGATGDSTRQIWEDKNNEAFGVIIVTLSAEQAGLFIGETKAKVVWEKLKQMHEGNAEDRRIDIALELKDIRMNRDESVSAYMTRARNIASRSAALGQIINTREIVYHVVRGLPSRMDNVSTVLRAQRNATLEEVQSILQEEESRQKVDSNGQLLKFGIRDEKAFKAGENKGRNNDKKCFVCGKTGHIARNCWHRNGEGQGNNRARRVDQRREQANVVRSEVSDNRKERAFAAHIEKNKIETLEWSLDSGCTTHMTPNKNLLINGKEIDCEVEIAEKGRGLKATAQGDIKVRCDENIDIIIKDVMYVPNLRSNLLSIRSLMNQGNSILFEDNCAIIYDKYGDKVIEAPEKNKMYVFSVKSGTDYVEDDVKCLNIKDHQVRNSSNKELWHRRMGHLNEKYLDKLKEGKLVHGIEYKSQRLPMCEFCVLGKMTQSPFKPITETKATQVLELIHIDLCGPMPVPSIGGARYVCTIVDEYSKRIFSYFLKNKEETFEYFNEFRRRYQRETGKNIKMVRSDNGTEFVNRRFQEMFVQEGIRHQRTVVHSPQSNGSAERANRTLLDIVRTMLVDAALPTEYWAEAMAAATYVRNVTPTKGERLETPMGRWTGRPPVVSHIRVFGCKAYYYVNKTKRGKLDPRARGGIFVGYSRIRKAYRIFDAKTRTIHEARTVKFNETKRGIEDFTYLEGGIHEPQDIEYIAEIDELGENIAIDEGIYLQPNEPEDHQEDQIPVEPIQQQMKGRKKGETNQLLKNRLKKEREENEKKLIEEGARRSERIQDKHQVNMTRNCNNHIPLSYTEAMNDESSLEWKLAMDREIKSLKTHKVWDLVPRQMGMKVIKAKWIYNNKENTNGEVIRRKARLVAVGTNQTMGIDYSTSYSPVMKRESLRVLLAIAAQLNMKIRRYDIETAYLYGNLSEEVWMEQPKGYEEGQDLVCKLSRSLYGLPQSGRCWNERLNQELGKLNMVRMKSDPCIYRIENEEGLLILGVYVDDLMVIGTNSEVIENVVTQLGEVFQLNCSKPEDLFLGMEIGEDVSGINLSQTGYIEKILYKYKLDECNAVGVPGSTNQDLSVCQDSERIDMHLYQEMIGSLLYLATGTRPDIAHAVSNLSQYNQDPRLVHMKGVKRVYRYLKGTKDYRLHYPRRVGELNVSTDASWGNTPDGKSFSGFTVKLGESLVNWKAQKQRLVALSTCESELIAICEGVKEINGMAHFLSELEIGDFVRKPVILKTDSRAAIDWVKGEGSSARTKHINRRYYFVKDEVKEGNIELQYENTQEMEADMLTKSVPWKTLQICNQKVGLFTRDTYVRTPASMEGSVVAKAEVLAVCSAAGEAEVVCGTCAV